MILLHNIGPIKHNSNYNTREEILASNEPLSFDGVYLNVYENRDVLEGKDVTLFIMGNYVGKDNSFDEGMPLEKLCDWNQIMDLAINYGCKLGWHTWSHPDLTTLTYEEILNEVTPPFPMDYFAYPYGRYNEEAVAAVIAAGFKVAYSVTQGNENQYELKRSYL